jgi:hypothetical protein
MSSTIPQTLSKSKGSPFDNEQCSICHQTMSDTEDTLTHTSNLTKTGPRDVPCISTWHRACILEWLDPESVAETTCPHCDAQLIEDEPSHGTEPTSQPSQPGYQSNGQLHASYQPATRSRQRVNGEVMMQAGEALAAFMLEGQKSLAGRNRDR